MQIRKVFGLNGPNIWANSAVLEAWVDLGRYEDFPTSKLPGFSDRLMSALPSLIEHRCSLGERGGFLQRMREGTWLGHVLEHVTLELQTLTHSHAGFGRARETSERGVYKVIVKCEDTGFAEHCLRAGHELILATAEQRELDLEQRLQGLRQLADRLCLGPSTRAIVRAASARGIPSIRLSQGNLIQLGYGSAQRRIWTAETDRTSAIAEGIAQDKQLTRSLLALAGVPVPSGRAVEDAADAWLAAEELGEPVVVKPRDGNHGRGVSIRLDEQAQVSAAYARASLEGSGVVVERFVRGTQHRVLVVGDRAIAATGGDAEEVIGDGVSSVKELVERANLDPRRAAGFTQVLSPLRLNDVGVDLLRQQGLSPASVPKAGARVLLHFHGDLIADETDILHPDIASACVLAAQTVGLDIAGIDIVAEDISRPLAEQAGAVIEVNASPGLAMHLKPLHGQPRPVGEAIIDQLFGPEESGRVPVIAVAGTCLLTETSRLIAELLRASGREVARADSSGLYLGGRILSREVAATAEGARRALMNPAADAVVLEVTAASTLEQGLGFDRCQIAVVTSLAGAIDAIRGSADELGTIEKAVRAPVDVVLPTGFALLSASETQVAALGQHCKGKVVFFGGSPGVAPVREHLATGGQALVRLGSQILWCTGEEREQIGPGARGFGSDHLSAEPMLAAVAVGLLLGLDSSSIRAFVESLAGTIDTAVAL